MLYWIVKYMYLEEMVLFEDVMKLNVFIEYEYYVFLCVVWFFWIVRCYLYYIIGWLEEWLSFDL